MGWRDPRRRVKGIHKGTGDPKLKWYPHVDVIAMADQTRSGFDMAQYCDELDSITADVIPDKEDPL